MIDTLETVHALRASGMEEKQAEAIARVVFSAIGQSRDDLVTKADLSAAVTALEYQISGIRTDLERQNDTLRTDLERQDESLRVSLERQIDELRSELHVGLAGSNAAISDVVAKMESIRSSLIMWMIGLVIAVSGITFTLARFVHPG